MKKYKLPGNNQIPAEMILAGDIIVIHKYINSFGIRKNCLIRGRNILLYQSAK
jgi:hypothetical protein